MAVRRQAQASSVNKRPPATTPEARERQLVGDAMALAEKQIREGTASAQVITHFLKIGSGREKLEREKIESENELLKARIENLAAGKDIQELYGNAIDAMRMYSGQEVEADYDD
jgi:hypothetical protein